MSDKPGTFEGTIYTDFSNPCYVCGNPEVFLTTQYEGKEVHLCVDCDEQSTQEFIRNHTEINLN